MHLKRFGIVLLLLALLPAMVFAQEATEEPEATEETVLQISTETELTEVSTVGPATFSHPVGWGAITGGDGTIIIGNVDLESVMSSDQLPQETLIVQVRLIGLNRVNGLGDNPTAVDVLEALTANPQAEGDPPEVTTLEGENFTFARADVGNEQTSSTALTFLLEDASLGLVTASSLDTGSLGELETVVINILDSFSLEVEIPFAEDVQERYTDYEIGTTEEGFPRLGSPDAPVTVTEISSFDCPACAQFHDVTFPELLPRIAAGDINFVYVPIYGTGSIPNGDSAARAALCMADDFWAYHDGLFAWHEYGDFAYLYERLYDGAVQEFGVDGETFNECYASDETTAVLQTAFTEAQSIEGFTGTPTILVNGNIVPNAAQPINQAIDLILSGEIGSPESDEDTTESGDN
jgi:protein-disulfide isomerase